MHVHTVLVKLHDPATADECRELMESMRDRIASMIDLRVTTNELGGNYACDLSLTTTWPDVEAYHAYAVDPVHLEVQAAVLALMSDGATIDYTADTLVGLA